MRLSPLWSSWLQYAGITVCRRDSQQQLEILVFEMNLECDSNSLQCIWIRRMTAASRPRRHLHQALHFKIRHLQVYALKRKSSQNHNECTINLVSSIYIFYLTKCDIYTQGTRDPMTSGIYLVSIWYLSGIYLVSI